MSSSSSRFWCLVSGLFLFSFFEQIISDSMKMCQILFGLCEVSQQENGFWIWKWHKLKKPKNMLHQSHTTGAWSVGKWAGSAALTELLCVSDQMCVRKEECHSAAVSWPWPVWWPPGPSTTPLSPTPSSWWVLDPDWTLIRHSRYIISNWLNWSWIMSWESSSLNFRDSDVQW